MKEESKSSQKVSGQETTPNTNNVSQVNSQNNNQQKGVNIWKWILIGCLGIIILGLIIAGGCSYFMYKKGKEVADDIQKEINNKNIPAIIQEELEKGEFPQEVQEELKKQGIEIPQGNLPSQGFSDKDKLPY